MKRRITVRAIILKDGKLLCARLKPHKNHLKRDNTYWSLPGGGLEDGEALIACLERELVEETGILPHVGNLMYVQQFMYGDTDYLEFFFHVTNGADYTQIDLSQTTHGKDEIEEIGFIDPSRTHVLPEFLKTEDLVRQANNTITKLFNRYH